MKKPLILISLLLIANSLSAEHRVIRPYPFRLGEKCVFTVRALGVILGDQIVTVDNTLNINGATLITGKASVKSTPAVSKIYKLDDVEITYFRPSDLNPLYNEKWINEGDWKDHMVYHFLSGKVLLTNRQNGYRPRNIAHSYPDLKNYYTLLTTLRSLDYDYYVKNKQRIVIHYLLGEKPVTAVFTARYTTVNYNRRKRNAVALEENKGGLGFRAVVLLDEYRTPYSLTIPAYNAGKKSIDFQVTIKSFTPGKTSVPLTE